MELKVYPAKKLQGAATPPSSKSHSVRALLFALLAKGKSQLRNVLDADDTRAAINVCKSLGAKINIQKSVSGGLDIQIESNGIPLQKTLLMRSKKSNQEIFTSNSGITTTFTVPILGLRQYPQKQITLSCGEQMMKRPLESIINAVNKLGMEALPVNKNGKCPLKISGKLEGGNTSVDGENSQYLSALLMSLPCAEKNSVIKVKNLKELPYVDMTLSWLDEQNIRYRQGKEGKTHMFKIFGNQEYHPFTKTVPGDFSSASYLLAAAVLLPGFVTLHGLNMDDPQGDKRLISILQQMGADMVIVKTSEGHVLKIQGGKPLKGTVIDANDIPDMLPTLAVIATQAKGKTTIMNVGNARIKETDRIKSMATELKKMGVRLQEKESALIIYESKLRAPIAGKSAIIHGYSDHRTIMAMAIAGLLADAPITIDTAEGINKTFPNFIEVMNKLGAKMERIHTRHIILIGFKNAGKSTIGKALSHKLKRRFLDLDDKIEEAHGNTTGEKISCHEIMKMHGENYFRKIEHQVLSEVIIAPQPLVLALGGGTPMMDDNQTMLSQHTVIEISAPKNIVFERIMQKGKPAFFSTDADPFESFEKLWKKRQPVYRNLADFHVENSGDIGATVQKISKKIRNSS